MPDHIEAALWVAAITILILTAVSFAVCVGMWVALALRERAELRRTAKAVLTPDDDELPQRNRRLGEDPDRQWLRDELDLTQHQRSAEIAALEALYDMPSYIRPPVSPGRDQ